LTRTKGFDALGFYEALNTTVSVRGLSWKDVARQTGVSQSTLSRMAIGRQPDASSLASLSAWAGLNPGDYVSGARHTREPLVAVGKLLREDPNLDKNSAEALEAIIVAAYERFKSNPKSS
jgi:transcriptional regulator with XRE-family HTH domain